MWNQIRGELRHAVGESTYDIWLSRLAARSWDGSALVLTAPPDTRRWITIRFERVIEQAARAVLGDRVAVTFAEDGAEAPHPPRRASPANGHAVPADAPAAPAERAFNPRLSFEQFIIGDGNRLAHAAALSVAEQPGQAFNPLFLHGPPGRGKTHLLHAIGNYLAAHAPGTHVRYTTVEAFTEHFVTVVTRRGDADEFRHRYRDADVLLIDDVQFLADKKKTAEEFFHTFNALYDTGRQLVLTSDRTPADLGAVADRLTERFAAGLVAELDPPDLATRLAILRKRVALDHVPVTDEAVLELIAGRVTDNVRSLEAALIRVVAHHSLTGRAIDVALAADVLGPGADVPPAGSPPTVGSIQDAVASHFHLTAEQLRSPARHARVAWPRQVAIALAKELTDCSLSELGAAFGGRSHTTILYACNRVSDRSKTRDDDAAEVDVLRRRLARG